ncbi:hypothetical protein QIS99_26150 [Streptomyces sp. B-S-A8]|uniref:Uncharacterized protein n=1 Tax=Streptomyces solicavernae TaxID=3043614 RepID=A0ABT6RYX1_9ACTN|nr:hypothetical protein [Streptomyces sp. B-S-A8]MDI3389643.1 hypothetical protein [Streptomyces sp. B-S-A8]
MALTISLVLLFGIGAFVLLRFKAVGPVAAVILVLFGFYLADTDARTTINDLVQGALSVIRSVDT